MSDPTATDGVHPVAVAVIPLTAQLGQGAARAVPLAIGVVGGILIYLTARAPARAPTSDGASLVAASAPE